MPHRALELLGAAPAVDAEWRGRLGTAYCALSRFLVAPPDSPLAETYYCSHCGGQLMVRPCPDGSFVALQEEDLATCPLIENLTRDDLLPRCLNFRAFFSATLDGLGVDESYQPLEDQMATWRIGSLRVSGKRHSVYASLLPSASDYLSVIRSISDERPFIFIGGSYHHECEVLLSRLQCGYLCLEDDFTLMDGSGFLAGESASEKFDAFKEMFTVTDPQINKPAEPQKHTPQFLFHKTGDMWTVVYNASNPFYIRHSLGALYLDYLLHHPGDVISALELELEVNPAKADIRAAETITQKHDKKALLDYAKRCRKLRAEREDLLEEGRTVEASQMDDEIEELERILQNEDRAVFSDNGENARSNVRKAINGFETKLKKLSEPAAKQFGRHLAGSISKGIKLSYTPPDKILWS